jgi:hypothetical protein
LPAAPPWRSNLHHLFVVTLIGAWLSHGHGVVRNDPDRRIYIPEVLTVPLQIKAVYNGEKIFFRYRWPADRPVVIVGCY